MVGDAVNVAARIEELNKKFGTKILISDSVYELVEKYVKVKTITLAHLRGLQAAHLGSHGEGIFFRSRRKRKRRPKSPRSETFLTFVFWKIDMQLMIFVERLGFQIGSASKQSFLLNASKSRHVLQLLFDALRHSTFTSVLEFPKRRQ